MKKRFSSAFHKALDAVAAMDPAQTELEADDAVAHDQADGKTAPETPSKVPCIKPNKGDSLN